LICICALATFRLRGSRGRIMWPTVKSALRRYYRIITGCALLTGIFLGIFQDVHNLALTKIHSFIWPESPVEQTCVETYFDAEIERPLGSYLIILTDLANDSDLTQSNLIDRSMRRLYGDDLGAAIQLERINCMIYSTTGNAGQRAASAKELASDIARRSGADVVLWGEVISRDELIALSMTHANMTLDGDYRVEESTLTTDFGADIGAMIAAKMLTLVETTHQDEGTYLVPRMRRVLDLTAPLMVNPPAQITPENQSRLYFAHAKALQYIGMQTNDVAKLEESVAAYQVVLQGSTQTVAPLDGAAIENNLGVVLSELGSHAEAVEAIKLLEQSKAAYQLALLERKREVVPLDWAMTQNNLGTVLWRLTKHASAEHRLMLLKEAVAAYRSSLLELKRAVAPLAWARTKNNLAGALVDLGRSTAGDAGLKLLEEANSAFQDALMETKREIVPFAWAQTHFNIGGVESAFFEKTGSAVHLEKAKKNVLAARQVYLDVGASQHVLMADEAIVYIDNLPAPNP